MYTLHHKVEVTMGFTLDQTELNYETDTVALRL